jgi:hypothetical protein
MSFEVLKPETWTTGRINLDHTRNTQCVRVPWARRSHLSYSSVQLQRCRGKLRKTFPLLWSVGRKIGIEAELITADEPGAIICCPDLSTTRRAEPSVDAESVSDLEGVGVAARCERTAPNTATHTATARMHTNIESRIAKFLRNQHRPRSSGGVLSAWQHFIPLRLNST